MASRYFLDISSGNKICGMLAFTISILGGDGKTVAIACDPRLQIIIRFIIF